MYLPKREEYTQLRVTIGRRMQTQEISQAEASALMDIANRFALGQSDKSFESVRQMIETGLHIDNDASIRQGDGEFDVPNFLPIEQNLETVSSSGQSMPSIQD